MTLDPWLPSHSCAVLNATPRPQALNIALNAGAGGTSSRRVAATAVGRDGPVPTLARRTGSTLSPGNGPKTIHARFQNVAVSELFLNWIQQP